MMYRFLLSNNKNIYFNLATEEYLLKQSNENYIFLWYGNPCVVVGKHQNLYAEINLPYVLKHNIAISRRLSGGGTVYHDEGNLNFSFISSGEEGKLVDFKKQTEPIIRVLNQMGVAAKLGARNNIFIGEKKISGNAEHIYKNRILHHGTLLFNSNLDALEETIKVSGKVYTDKAVKSVRASVVNIKDYLEDDMNVLGFINRLKKGFSKYYLNLNESQLSLSQQAEIQELANTKYVREEWIYSYSPAYTFAKIVTIENKKFDLELEIKKGVVTSVNSSYPLFGQLVGLKHNHIVFNKFLRDNLKNSGDKEIEALNMQLFY
jgi:lipoate-protein ligase A